MDTLKIDQLFVAEMLAQPRTRMVVETIVRLGRAMGLLVTTGNVGTAVQLQALPAMGCGLLQGYLLARPLSAAETKATLDRQRTAGGQAQTRGAVASSA